jgi:hypothetical protein
LDASGSPEPPQALVDGVRTILLYAVDTVGPNPRVFVDGASSGQLAGVLGSSVGLPALAHALALSGVAAAVQQPLVGGPGQRQVAIALGDDAPPRPPTPGPPGPVTGVVTPAKKATAKKATAKKATAKKAVAKKAVAKKAVAKKAVAKKAVAKKAVAKKAVAKKAVAKKTTTAAARKRSSR